MRELIVKVDDEGIYHIERELIRCENCIHGHIKPLTKDGTVKGMWCNDSAMYTLKQWCSRAERKEE